MKGTPMEPRSSRPVAAALLLLMLAPSAGAVDAPPIRPDSLPATATQADALAPGNGFSVELPQGGTVWATEDPTLGEPLLNVQAGSQAPFEGGRIVEPVRFHAYSNYAAFYERLEVSVYRGSDEDRVVPLATVQIPVGAVTDARWDGVLRADARLQAGDELQYVARAYAADGSFDETAPRACAA